MTPDQQFFIELLKALGPVFAALLGVLGTTITVVVSVAAARASKKAETAANHSKEAATVMQENFKAVMTIFAPEASKTVAATMRAPSNAQATPDMSAVIDAQT